MKQNFFKFTFSLILLSLFIIPVNAQRFQNRYATCDQCGLCPSVNPTPPGNWQKCVQCLYPSSSGNPQTKDTLLINTQTNLPPTPYPGRVYTMLGCVKTNLGSFQQEGAAASIVQVFLDLIFKIIGGLALLYLIYGAAVIMTSQANPERINYGKRVVMGAIIGVIFSLSAVFLVNFIASGVLRIPGFGQ